MHNVTAVSLETTKLQPDRGSGGGLSVIALALVLFGCGSKVDADKANGSYAGSGGTASDAGLPDATPSDDSGTCDPASVGYQATEFNTADLATCAIKLNYTPVDPLRIVVYVNCAVLPGTYRTILDGGQDNDWSIDYSMSPPSIVFGSTLCQQLRAMGSTSVYVLTRSGVT